MSAIEVERKFQLTPHTKQTLLALPSPRETVTYQDEYYDESLALKNAWLRKRNTEWELKLPVHMGCSISDRRLGATVYREYTGPDVWTALSKLNQQQDKLTCYASLTTQRTRLVMPWNKYSVNVTLDDCFSNDGFHCSIGELELMVDDENQVNAASQALDDVVEHLSVRQVEDKEGKLIKYIKHRRPAMFEKLVRTLAG